MATKVERKPAGSRDPMRIVLGLLSTMLLLGALGGCSFIEKQKHVARLKRIEQHIDHYRGKLPAESRAYNWERWPKPDEARHKIFEAINTALFNEFWNHQRCDLAKLDAIVARLDANNGADLATVEGCLLIVDLLEQVTPTARRYSWFATIHEEQALGNFPKLGGPVEKKP